MFLVIALFFVKAHLAAFEIFHALANKDVYAPVAHKKWTQKQSDFNPPDDRIDKNFFFLGHDGLMHPMCDLVGFERGQNPPKCGFKPFEQSRIDIVRVKIGHLYR